MASRKRTGSGRKGRGTEWDEVRKKDMYTTRKEIREKKKVAPKGGVVVSLVELCREASPAAEGGRAGKKGGERAKSMYVLYAYFFLFFCTSLQTQKRMVLLCISLCIHKKEKNVYVKLHIVNKAGVMRAYVYVCILRKCSGWFRCADFRKFCAGLFAYFFCWQPCGRQEKYVCLYAQKRKQNVYVYIHKKKNKMHMFTYAKFEAICIA